MDYFKLKSAVSKIIPRSTYFEGTDTAQEGVKIKGRKKNYRQFSFPDGKFLKHERLLKEDVINSFAEISCRAVSCPMPLNLDVWDSKSCPFRCQYCFADAYRSTLYTAFFDNPNFALRHCNPDFYKRELDKILKVRGTDPHKYSGVTKAVALGMPFRLGIRFEDFTGAEKKKGISLQLLQYLAEVQYNVMINTKSALIGTDKYVEALAKNKSAVHITMISSDAAFLKRMEPGAPTFKQRIEAAKNLTSAGVGVVARIEPFMIFLTDEKDMLQEYISALKSASIKNITFDTYSYSAKSPDIRKSFLFEKWDFDRMFLLGCDSQALGSLILQKWMNIFQKEGFSCSTFDQGNVIHTNDNDVCCECESFFPEAGFNYGSVVYAARHIMHQKGKPVSWKHFENFVMNKGGFLTEALKLDLWHLWNGDGGNASYSLEWADGLSPCGQDEYGIIWKLDNKTKSFREKHMAPLIE